MKTTKFILVLFFFFLSTNKIESCTIFFIEKDGVVLAGNNEDWKDPASKIFFYPAKNGKNGWIKFGWGSGFPQGGMNDKGVFWDGTSGPHLAMPISEASKTKMATPIMQKVIEECGNIEDAETIFSQYFCEDQYKAQYLVGDSSGNSIIVEGDNILKKTKNYQVLTNFYQSNPDLGGSPCWRFDKACEMLDKTTNFTTYFAGSILASTHQEGKYPTQYSNIYDLKNGLIYLFYFHNYDEFITINLFEELKKGNRSYDIPNLFSKISNMSTSVNELNDETSIIFSWDGLPASNYELIYSASSDFSNYQKVAVASRKPDSEKKNFAIVYLFFVLPFIKLKRKIVVRFIALILFFSLCGTACNKNDDDIPEDQKLITHTKTVTGFEADKTYYWKIKAKTDILNNFYSESVTEHFICN